MAISGAILFSLSRSPVGLILQASGQDAVQAGALGFNVTKHKLTAFIISAFFSGLAGSLMVFYLGSASVGTLVDITVGVQIIISAVLGGRRTILGAVLGAIFLIAMSEALRPLGDLSNFIVFAHGACRRAVVPERLFRPAHAHEGRRVSTAERPILSVRGLTKRFGGLVAVKEMALSVAAGKILGLIGPNGSGKSTVMKLIMGIERPDGGSVRINGVEVAGWPSHTYRPHGRRHRVSAFPPAASPDRAGKHQARAAARQAHPTVRGPADRRRAPAPSPRASG